MYCSRCGAPVQENIHFCPNCGTPLQQSREAEFSRPPAPARPTRSPVRQQDPYKLQIQQLKLQIKQLKLDLKRINTEMGSIRSRYYQTAAFVPRGLLRMGDKMIEDVRLMGPQQQKQQLQQQIIQLEQQLLGLQQAQARWKMQQQG